MAAAILGATDSAHAQTNVAGSPPPAAAATEPLPSVSTSAAPAEARLQLLVQNARNLQEQQKEAQKQTASEDQKKRIDLLQKQIETQQKLIELLLEQMKKQAPAGAPVEKLQEQTATLESRSQRGAQRDQELADAVDSIVEHQDGTDRYGPTLPAPLKELFLPGGNNETPLSIYGTLAVGYSKIMNFDAPGTNSPVANTPGGFYFGEFTPDFFVKLNDWIFLEAEIGVGSDGSVSAGSFAQVDFFVNDWLTIIAGRIVAPIGWYNERLNNPWVNKLPTDAGGSPPLPWLQVMPPLSMLGIEARGSFYLGASPLKMEYAAFVSNGLNVTPSTAGAPTIDELANLENMENTFNLISNDKALGGRIGLWWPEMGLEAGISGMYNGDYVAGGYEDSMMVWAADFNFHKGNWDVRAEYGLTYQQAGSFAGTPGLIGNNIRREGFYGQVAYRPYDCSNKYFANTEAVYRYSYVDFNGIDPSSLNLSSYSTAVDVPVRRQQNEFGINYYFYPRMVLHLAYQINDEPNFHLHDNQFITELAWGW
jgi:hypothetical protein